jgi:signal peptidase I
VIIQVMRVRGESLAPRYHDGDYVIVSGLGLKRIQSGDIIVFTHPEYGRLIKRVERIEPCGRLHVRGEDIDSVDSRRFGAIPPSLIYGKVVWRIPRRAKSA